MQHPWILPFLPLTSAPIQLTLPHPSQHHHHHTAVHQQVPASTMGLTLQPVMTPSGTLLLPALQQNAAAAVAAFAAAAAAQGSWPSMANSAVMMTNFPRCRLKASERENHPVEANGKSASEKRKHHDETGEPFKDVKRAKIETRALKAKRPGFSEERYNETEYFFENGLRKVYPYYFTFTTFTKGRWVGEKILDVFAREFRAHPVEEYERCIKSGTLTVNYEKVDVDYRLKHNDLLANIVHRHETPVKSHLIEVVYQDDDMVVVDKPCSVPVHPCGRYRHNTVAFILAKEHNLRNLRTIHRLDRLTSGLLMFGRTQERARIMEQQIRTRQVSKQYVCRVEGEFPSDYIVCNEPIEVVSYKIGVCRVSPKGKECRTEFERLSYNGKTSVVLCKPHTGRMHQIRVHLQYLGFPIVNDPLYNHTVFGPEKGKDGIIGKSDEDLIQDLISIHNAENWLGGDGDEFAPSFFSGGGTEDAATPTGIDLKIDNHKESTASPVISEVPAVATEDNNKSETKAVLKEDTESENATSTATANTAATDAVSSSSCNDSSKEKTAGEANDSSTKVEEDQPGDSTYDSDKLTCDEHCYECKVRFRDPKPRDLMMFLHAWRYSGPDWSYETKLPSWAQAEWFHEEF